MSVSSIPVSMEALVTQADKTAAVRTVPVPTIDEDEILVRTVAVALNPTDWKFMKQVTNAGTICGCDWSGYVIQTGKRVTSFAVGDHVAGFVQGGTWDDRGAFAEYVKTAAELAWKVPQGMLSHEEAATMGCAFYTAVQALFNPNCLALTEPPETAEKDEWVLIYGGSSSVGMFAIQLAKLAGYKVVTTCSPRNFELCKSLGADAVFDYRGSDVVSKIKETTGDSIHEALDAISEASSQKTAVQAFAQGPGKMVTILYPDAEAQGLREDVSIKFTVVYTALGRAFSYGDLPRPAVLKDREHMAKFLNLVPELVSTGNIKPNRVKLWEGGLYGINDGLQYLIEGKNSGEKIVYKLK